MWLVLITSDWISISIRKWFFSLSSHWLPLILYLWVGLKFSSICIGVSSGMVSVGFVQRDILLGVTVCNNPVQSRSHCLVAIIPVLSLLHSFYSCLFIIIEQWLRLASSCLVPGIWAVVALCKSLHLLQKVALWGGVRLI